MARVKRRKGERVEITFPASKGQLQRWQAAGRYTGRDLQDFLTFAVEWTYRYLRETYRERKRKDPVGFRMEEKRRMDGVVRAAKEAGKFLPLAFETRNGISLDPAGDLDRAVRHLEDWWAESGEPFGI